MSQNFDDLPNVNPPTPGYIPPAPKRSSTTTVLFIVLGIVLFCCLLLCCVFVVLPVLLGPSIGNVFSEIIQTLEATPNPGFIHLF